MNLHNHAVKAILCDIHTKAVEPEQKCQPVTMTDLSKTLWEDSIQDQVVAVVPVISLKAYPFLAFSDLICHFDRGDWTWK